MTNLCYRPETSRGIGHRSVFLHAWDLAGEGADPVMQSAAEAGFNVVFARHLYIKRRLCRVAIAKIHWLVFLRARV